MNEIKGIVSKESSITGKVNVGSGSGRIVIDKTLTIENAAADAKAVGDALGTKQNKLIAGDNITIAEDGRTISASGGGTVTVDPEELDAMLADFFKPEPIKEQRLVTTLVSIYANGVSPYIKIPKLVGYRMDKLKFEIKGNVSGLTGADIGALFGLRDGNSVAYLWLQKSGDNWNWSQGNAYKGGGDTVIPNVSIPSQNSNDVFILTPSKAICNGTEYVVEPIYDTARTVQIEPYIFSVDWNGTSSRNDKGVKSIDYIRIYNDNELICNLLPCVDVNDVACLYESISKTCYYSANNAAFGFVE